MWMICLVWPVLGLIFYTIYLRMRKDPMNVCVLVLGDLGRSPRMQYHALSCAREGFTVDFIGYPGSLPLKEILKDSRIRIHYLQPAPQLENMLPSIVCYLIKVVWQMVTLIWILFFKPVSSYVIMQNPPAIPAMQVCWLLCIITGSKFTIDWHNYTYSLMALCLNDEHIVVHLAQALEREFGRRAASHFCVSKAMREDLQKRWGIRAQVLYDRPADAFRPISLVEKHEFLLRLSETYRVLGGDHESSTVFTNYSLDGVTLYANRPGLIVSSTSWTGDEDFSMLVNALQEYEDAIKYGDLNCPDLICVITGKGPLKEFYLKIIDLRDWKYVTVITPWLEMEDYPKMLASADLGICLHTSTSGLDLPMKVVDMFGCGLPVCAYQYKCLHELVRHNENSLVFSNERELAAQLKSWFENFPNNGKQRKLDEKFRQELKKFQQNRWHGNWTSNALPSFRQ